MADELGVGWLVAGATAGEEGDVDTWVVRCVDERWCVLVRDFATAKCRETEDPDETGRNDVNERYSIVLDSVTLPGSS